MTINRKWLVASIEQKTNRGSWKTIWNYDTVSAERELVQRVAHTFSKNSFITFFNMYDIPVLMINFQVVNNFILQGFMATKVLPEKACYLSIMNRTEMPSFDALPQLAADIRVRLKKKQLLRKLYFMLSKLIHETLLFSKLTGTLKARIITP